MSSVWIPPQELTLAHQFAVAWAQREDNMSKKWSQLAHTTRNAEIALLSTKFLCVVEVTGDDVRGWTIDLSPWI